MVPISPIMVWVMGVDAAKSGRPPTADETTQMQRILDEGLEAGGCGWGVQRLGEFSNQADFDGSPMPTDVMGDDLILAFGEVSRRRDQGTIMLAEAVFPDPDVLRAGGNIVEILLSAQERFLRFEEKLAETSQRPVVHNIVVPVDDFPDAHRSRLRWLEECQARGLRLYGQGNTIRNILIFRLENFTFFDSSRSWAETFIGGDRNQILQRLQDERLLAGIRYEEAMLIKEAIGGSIEGVSVFAVGDHPELERYVGRKVGDIAAEENKLPVDVLLDLTLASELDAEFKCKSFGGINPDMLGEVARSPYVIPGISDGGAHTKFLVGASYPTDLLAWLVRDEKQLTLEDAHWHLSHLPAHIYGLKDRGVIREGAAADIVVYDLDRLGQVPATEFEIAHDFPAGEWRRIQRAAGYRWILVNGEVTFEEGECSKATPGRLLRNGVG
jgi:hypothetical protein